MVALCTEVFDAVLGDRPNQLDRTRDEVSVTADELLDVAVDAGHGHRGRPAQQHQRRRAVPRGVAARLRRRRHQQHDGGRRDRRDLPLAGVAVAAQRRPPATTAQTVTRELVERLIDEEMTRSASGSATRRSATAAGRTPAACSPRWRWPRTSRTSSPSRRTSGCRRRPSRRPPGRSPARGTAAGRARATTPSSPTGPQLRTYECDGLAQYKVTPGAGGAAAEHGAGGRRRARLRRRRGPVRRARLGHRAVRRRAAARRRRAHRHCPRCAPSSTIDPADQRAVVRARRHQPAGDPGGRRRTATTTRRTRPASRSARSAATSRRTPAARTA